MRNEQTIQAEIAELERRIRELRGARHLMTVALSRMRCNLAQTFSLYLKQGS